jgi:hypothetical protein
VDSGDVAGLYRHRRRSPERIGETYLKGMHHTLSRLTAQVIEPLDVSDDRLSHLLTHLSKPTYWHRIEHDLHARSIEVYALSQGVIRCDATTVSGEHEVTAGGL